MNEVDCSESEFNALLCADSIARVDDNSDEKTQRARVHFKNGHSLSIIRGQSSFGGDEGLFEIMPSDEALFDDDEGGWVLGHLSAERVGYYINKIGSMGA